MSDDWRDWEPSRPKRVEGGIRARSKKGEFAGSWWGKRWIEVLESFEVGARLKKGKSYARQGQVLSVEVGPGLARARVQGSRDEPYDVAIAFKLIPPAGRKALGRVLASEPVRVAKLLAGEMPADIERAFEAAGLSLFPGALGDLTTKCSCPDWSNPCKHVAAVYYLLAEEFDRDPFLIFALRGLDRDGLLALIGGAPKPTTTRSAPTPPAPIEPLPASHAAFWVGGDLPADFFGEVAAPPVAAALPRRLGPFPFWTGRRPLIEAVATAYDRGATRGLDAFLGDPAPPGPIDSN